jgi:hypothetical protein
LKIPSEEDKLLELDLDAAPGTTKSEKWHAHVLHCEEEDLEPEW